MTIENESKRPLDGSLKWGGNTYKFGYNPGYKRGRRFSSLVFQRLYASDFFESHVLRQNLGADEALFFVGITGFQALGTV